MTKEIKTFEQIFIGQKERVSRYITEADIVNFANISWDHNKLHTDPDFAHNSYFGKRIVHGAFIFSQVSSLIANKLPGVGSILIKANIVFKAPLYINDTLTVEGEIKDKINKNKRIIVGIKCYNQNQKIIAEGDVTVMMISDLDKIKK